jgi:uncharacterized membrane protein YhaH (DUF805 family)
MLTLNCAYTNWLYNFKRGFDFQGRTNRESFWLTVATNFSISLILGAFGYLTKTDIFGILIAIYSLIWLIPSVALDVRRLHDSSRSGWYALILLIPYIGTLIVLLLCAIPSTPYTNQYGVSDQKIC